MHTPLLILLLIGALAAVPISAEAQGDLFEWQELPALPKPLAGQYVGVHNAALIVAGGTNFPTSLFEGGKKVWWDDVFVLDPGRTQWRAGFRLQRPLAYGAAVSTGDGVLCIGGGDAQENVATVFRLRWADGRLERPELPELPQPCAMTSAAILGNTVYVAGGQESPDAHAALRNFWALDLSVPQPRWQELEPWPGAGRILAVAASQDGAFYLFSGAELFEGPDGRIRRRFLRDGYRFRPGQGWQRIADLPRPVVAAPAVSYGSAHIFVFGGDDGRLFEQAWELKEDHPGFSREVLAYHTITDTWTTMGTLPAGYVTTGATLWQGRIVIPGGEDRPGHRSVKVLAGRLRPSQGRLRPLDYGAILLYFVGLVWMGIFFSRREHTTDDFFLAGRRVPWWAAGVSIFGTQLSAITFLAVPARAYATDWVYFIVNMTIILVAPVVVFFYLPYFRRLDVTTAYEYLEKRFNVAVRLFGSTAFILFQLGRIGIVLFLPALALSAAVGINIYLAILAMGILCVVYTVLGGIEAVIWTDVSQVVVLVGSAVLSLVIIITDIDGGLGTLLSLGWAEGKLHMLNWTWDITVEALWLVVVGNLFANAIPYTSDQTIVQRYLTTRTEKEAAQAIWTNAALTLPASILFFGLGTALYVFYKLNPGLLDPTLQTDAIFPLFIVQKLPIGLTGLVVAGIFAASMSSLDSSLNSVATAIVTDFYRRFRARTEDRAALRLARWLTLLFGAIGTGIALVMATFEIRSLLDLFREILGLFGGSLAGLFALGVFTRRANGAGALVGAMASAVVLFFVQSATEVHFFLYAAIGMVTCFAVGYLASLALGAPVGASLGLDGLQRKR